MTQPLTDQQLDEIEQRASSEHLTPGPWDLAYEACDCGGDYPCGHGPYVTGVITPVPTSMAADRCKRTGEEPRDYDFHRGEIGDFTEADWALMVAAREDVPVLLAELRRLGAELHAEQSRHAYTLRQRNNRSTRLIHLRELAEAGDTQALLAAAMDVLAASVNDHTPASGVTGAPTVAEHGTEAPEPHETLDRPPTALLRDAERYLSALHGSVGRHDNLAANYGCAGCELRDKIQAHQAAASGGGR